MRRLIIASIGSIVGAVLILLFIPLVFKGQVSAILQNYLNKNVQATVSFSTADIDVWQNFPQLTVSLENFLVNGEKEFLGDTLLSAEELTLVLSTKELLFNDGVEIRHLALKAPDIFLTELSNGKTNYDVKVDNSTDSAREVKLDIQSWEVSEGRFRYENVAAGVKLRADGVSLAGKVSIRGSVTNFTVAAITHAFTAFYGSKKYIQDKHVIFNLDGSYDASNNMLAFSENALSVNNLDLIFSGSLGFQAEETDVDLKIKSGEAEFEDILSLSQVLFRDFKKMDIEGQMSLDAQFLGTFNSAKDLFPAFKMNLVVSQGIIKYKGLPSSLNEINFDLAAYNTDGNLDNTNIDLQYFGMNVGDNPVFGSASVHGFKDGKVSADVLARFPLSELAFIYPMDGLFLTGNLDFELKANGAYSGRLVDLTTNRSWDETKIPAFDLGIKLTDGNVKYAHLPEAISNVNLDLFAENKSGILDDTFLRIEKLQALLGDNPISGSVTISGLSEPDINGNVKAKINLEEVANFYPLNDISLKGVLDMNVEINGKASASSKLFPEVLATLRLDNGFIRSQEYPAPMENTHLVLQAINETGKFADTKFIIDTLTYVIENEAFFVSGSVQDLDNINYDLDVKGILYLEKLQKIFSLSNTIMRGEVDVDFRTAGNLTDLKAKKYHQLPTEGHLRMHGVFVKNETFAHGLQIKEGHMFFTNEKIVLDTLHGTLGQSHFSLAGHLYNYMAYALHTDETMKGDLQFQSENFDINEMLRDGTGIKDTVHHDLAVMPIQSTVDFTFESKIDRLHYKNLSFDNFEGTIVVRNGVLTLVKTTFNAMDASFDISGDYDPRDMRHPKFDFQVGIEGLDINKAHDAFVTVQAIAPAAEHTYGIFSINYALKGELMPDMFPVVESLEGGGMVWISDAKVNGMKLFHHMSGITKKQELMNPKLKDIVMETVVEKGVIYVKPFSMKLAGFETEIEGKHELSGTMNYVLKIALPPFDIVKIPMHIDGTYDNPKVHIGKGREEDLKKAIEPVNN